MKITTSNRAQVMMTDLFIALSIFLILMIAIFSFMMVYERRVNSNMAYEDMRAKAMQIANFLVKSPGVPADWEYNSTSPQAIGLAPVPLILSNDKVANFTRMDYDKIRKTFNIRHYDFSFMLFDLDSNLLASKGNESENESVSISRYVRFNNTNSIMLFKVFRH